MTLVLGASPNPMRYANLAIRRLRERGYPVLAIGKRQGMVADVPIQRELPPDALVDTVTMYLSAANQAPWEDLLLALSPRRIIFNPGAENPAFAKRATAQGVEVENACTLVMLATGVY